MAGDVAVVAQDWSLLFSGHFSKKDGIQVAAEEYVVFVAGDAGRHRLELAERQMVCDVGYVGRQVGFGIEEASFEVRLIRGEKDQIRPRHRRRRPSFPSPRSPRDLCVRLHLHTVVLSVSVLCADIGWSNT